MTDTNDLLFELGTEELPPVALKKLSEALTSEFIAGLDNANLEHGAVESYAAPRRLAPAAEPAGLDMHAQVAASGSGPTRMGLCDHLHRICVGWHSGAFAGLRG